MLLLIKRPERFYFEIFYGCWYSSCSFSYSFSCLCSFIIFTISTFTHICATKSIFLVTTAVSCTIWLARVWYHLDQLGQVDFLPFNRYFTDQGFTHSVLVCKIPPGHVINFIFCTLVYFINKNIWWKFQVD